MNCREAERLIETFYDGELDGRSMRDAAMHITRCKRCESELNDRERIQKLLSSAIEEQIAGVDLSRIWAAVEPTIAKAARTAPTLRRLGLGEHPRLAATSARVGGLLLGRRPDESGDHLVDENEWDAPHGKASRVWRWSVAGGVALAASVLIAVALVPRGVELPGDSRTPAIARDGARPVTPTGLAANGPAMEQAPAQAVAQRAPFPPAGASSFDMARADLGRSTRTANKQVQVESVNFPRSSVAMWSEPATDTTVIWIEDEELAASGRR